MVSIRNIMRGVRRRTHDAAMAEIQRQVREMSMEEARLNHQAHLAMLQAQQQQSITGALGAWFYMPQMPPVTWTSTDPNIQINPFAGNGNITATSYTTFQYTTTCSPAVLEYMQPIPPLEGDDENTPPRVVRIPYTAMSSDAAWEAWIAEDNARRAERQAARAAYERDQRDEVLRREAAERRRDQAQERARTILLEHLTPEQRATYQGQRPHFRMRSSRGNEFIIMRGNAGNVYRLRERNRSAQRLCATIYDMPTEDIVLAQKLMLETDEDAFLRVANPMGELLWESMFVS